MCGSEISVRTQSTYVDTLISLHLEAKLHSSFFCFNSMLCAMLVSFSAVIGNYKENKEVVWNLKNEERRKGEEGGME